MITTALLVLLKGVIDFIISIRPAWSVHIPGAGAVVSAAMAMDAFAPVAEMVACAGLYVTGFVAVMGWKWTIKIMDWIADVIP